MARMILSKSKPKPAVSTEMSDADTPTPISKDTYTPTAEQQSLFDTTKQTIRRNPSGLHSISVVYGVAGCGKTATAVRDIQQHKGAEMRFVSFTNAATKEMEDRLLCLPIPITGVSSTYHKFGKALVNGEFRRPRIEMYKSSAIIKSMAVEGKWRNLVRNIQWGEQKSICDLIGLMKTALIGKVVGGALEVSSTEEDLILDMIDCYDIDIPSRQRVAGDDLVEFIVELLRRSILSTDTIDMADMVAMPAYYGLRLRRPLDILYVDEFQDSDKSQIHLALSNTGYLVAIGDDKQSIYAFRGAGSGVMQAMEGVAANVEARYLESALTCNWRSGSSIIELAQKLVPQIKARPGAPEGRVMSLGTREGLEMAASAARNHAAEGGAFIVARRNAPLLKHYFKLLKAGVPSYRSKGRSAGNDPLVESVGSIIKSADKMGVRSLDGFNHAVERIIEEKVDSVVAKGGRNVAFRIDRLKDLKSCVLIIGEQAVGNCDRALGILMDLCPSSPVPGAVQLMTVHKAKGMEAHTVMVTDLEAFGKDQDGHDLSGVDGIDNGGGDELVDWDQQERNLAYIAVTRPKETLIFDGSVPGMFR
jgi:superfamily I DNA/RNA helicase